MQEQKQHLYQEQKLKMNPQLYQSIQLMSLPLQELRQKIGAELEQNPALEMVKEEPSLSLDDFTISNDDTDYFENSSDPGYSAEYSTNKEKYHQYKSSNSSANNFIEGTLTRPQTLHEYLIWQLKVQPIPKAWTELGETLIYNLDENGFHQEPPENCTPKNQLHILPKVLNLIQKLDPPGIGTANFKEALIVQVNLDSNAHHHAVTIISNYLDLLKRERFDEIAKALDITKTEVKDIAAYIRTLNPFPGRSLDHTSTQYVVPDLFIAVTKGELKIILNDEEIPVLGIDPFFSAIQKEKCPDNKTRQFVSHSVRQAKWFIHSIHLRNSTLLRIAKAIAEFQRDFFIRGPKYLVPLTLKDIAEEVSVHETTVSRIANAKYVQTEWGIYPLRFFFSNSISGSGAAGSRFSKEGVKEIIKEIIEKKNTGKQLSDQKISDLLKKQGISIARRTVTKYRKELSINSSFER